MSPPPALKIDHHPGMKHSKSVNDIILLMSEREEREHNRITVIRCADNPETRRKGWAGQAWHASHGDQNIHLTLQFSNDSNDKVKSWKHHVKREDYNRMKAVYRARVGIFENDHVIESTRQKIVKLIRKITRKLDDHEGKSLDLNTEVKLLNEVWSTGTQLRELEKAWGKELEDKGYFGGEHGQSDEDSEA